jgi:hypothetical protein
MELDPVKASSSLFNSSVDAVEPSMHRVHSPESSCECDPQSLWRTDFLTHTLFAWDGNTLQSARL